MNSIELSSVSHTYVCTLSVLVYIVLLTVRNMAFCHYPDDVEVTLLGRNDN